MNGLNSKPEPAASTPSTEEEGEEQAPVIEDEKFLTLLQHLEQHAPSIPDSVTEHYLNRAGMNTDDTRIVRLVSLAGQKFLSDILNDAWRLSKLKVSAQAARSNKNKEKRSALVVEDVASALQERGITLHRSPYYT